MKPVRSSVDSTRVSQPFHLASIPSSALTFASSAKSPWSALEYCAGVNNVEDTWICHAPESCGCQWNATYDLLTLSPRGCADMGDDARVALYAPSALAPYVSLPSTYGGPTLYYSGTTVDGTSTWISTALESCKSAIAEASNTIVGH